VISLFFIGVASGVDYYVNATGGSDPNNGTSTISAWKTIAMINNHTFNPGDNIYLARGETWGETLTVPSSGNSSDYITFGAYGEGSTPLINGSNTRRYGITVNSKQYLIFENFELYNFNNTESTAGFNIFNASSYINLTNILIYTSKTRAVYIAGTDSDNYAQNIILDNCTFYDIGDWGDSAAADMGINNYARNITIQNSRLYGNGADKGVDGITFEGVYGAGHLIKNNIIHSHQENEIDFKDHNISIQNESNSVVENNSLYGSHLYGIIQIHDGANNIEIRNNIIRNGDNNGISITYTLGGEGNISIHNNLIYNNSVGAIVSGTGAGVLGYNQVYNNVAYNNGLASSPSNWAFDLYTNYSTIKNNILYKNGLGRGSGYTPQIRLGNVNESFIIQMDYNLLVIPFSSRTFYYNGDYRSLSYMQSNTGLCQHDLGGTTDYPWPFAGTEGDDNYQLPWNSELIDRGTLISATTDFDGNPIYGTPDIGAFEYQPPYNISVDKINTSVSKNIRIYGDGKYRYINSSTASVNANLSLNPVSGFNSTNYSEFFDINVSFWNTDGNYSKNWTEYSGTLGTSANVTHIVSDLKPNTYFGVKVDSVVGANISGANCVNGICLSDSSGKITFNYTGGYSSHSFEIVDLTSPVITFSCTPTSLRTGQGISCSCSATDEIDSTPTVSYTASPTTSETGTYTTTCAATDDDGNSATSDITYVVSPSASDSTGSGSSSATWSNTYLVSEEQFNFGYTKELSQNQRIIISVAGNSHHVGIKSIFNNSATIEISSEPIIVSLEIGGETKVDVTSDGYYDIYVKLNSISNYKADLTVKSISEKIPEEIKSNAEVTNGEIVNSSEETSEEVSVGKNNFWIYFAVGLIVVLIVLLSLFLVKKRR